MIHKVYVWESHSCQTCVTTQETSYPLITKQGLFLTNTVEFMAMSSKYILWDHRWFCLDCKQGGKNLFRLNIQIYNFRFKTVSTLLLDTLTKSLCQKFILALQWEKRFIFH